MPAQRYEIRKQALATVLNNGHVLLGEDKHYYSVPYHYIRKRVKLLYDRKTVEIFHGYMRIAVHPRVKSPHHYSTQSEHLASTHRFATDWNPQRFINWAGSIDADVQRLISLILHKKQHPEQAYKSCMGILSLTKKVGKERLINACRKSLQYGIHNYMMVQNILDKGLDQIQEESQDESLPEHTNIRGSNYYQ